MQVKGKHLTIYGDEEFLIPLDDFAKKHKISRSSTIRLITTGFFSKKGAKF